MVRYYTISDFLHLDEQEKLDAIERFLNHVKRNKVIYSRLVLLIALVMKSNGIVYAESFETSLNSSARQIIDMLLVLAKYSFLGLGLKEMMSTMIAGGSFKDATTSGMQYLLTYVLIRLYPSLFNMFSKINF
ncbi:hypothetical protein [Terrisporobacter mayombei]|uniref:Uncharacterized protein n=1 Tax=Terrisporobacter mayombei TaxID=1541 RepID=A0ABY9PZC5_9FIRM|nr:hypothetical protein [Terrisporobacter mayombei]MCC3868529.1 hypothetical protein [Terrisporobacter mayombei]WMT80686.1 hypothetical protein TEMA_10070 [Terrisporobacter mayombei]